MQINVLEFIHLNPNSATTNCGGDIREKFWMYKLKSLKLFGINATDGSKQFWSQSNSARQNLASQTQSVPSSSETRCDKSIWDSFLIFHL